MVREKIKAEALRTYLFAADADVVPTPVRPVDAGALPWSSIKNDDHEGVGAPGTSRSRRSLQLSSPVRL